MDNDTVISADNIQKMGEVIALTCIKTLIVRAGKDLHYLYKGLLRDINRSKHKAYNPALYKSKGNPNELQSGEYVALLLP